MIKKKNLIQNEVKLLHALRKPRLKYTFYGAGAARVQIRLVYMYLLNVPSVSRRYFNKIKRTSLLGK